MKTKLINELFMELEQFRTVPTPTEVELKGALDELHRTMEAELKGALDQLHRTMEKYRTTPIYVIDPGSVDGDKSPPSAGYW